MSTILNSIVLSLTLLNFINGQQSSVTTDQLTTVQNDYTGMYLSSAYPDGFGVPLKAQGLLKVEYPKGEVQLGKPLSQADVANLPSISVAPLSSAQATFKAPNAFTLMLADANTLGHPDPQGDYRHFLENGATFGDIDSNGTMKLNPGSGTVVTSYAGPGPAANEGPHRYGWLLFAQPSGFKAPGNLSTANVAPGHWHVASYVNSSGLGDLVAASFFTVENGQSNLTLKPVLPGSTNTTSTNSSSTSNNTSTVNSTNPSANAKSLALGGPGQESRHNLIKGLLIGFAAMSVALL